MSPARALPEGSVLLHIGPQKTGSTAIQMAMHHSREVLTSHGVHYAGAKHTPREAGWAVLGKAAIGRPAPRPRAWDQLVKEIRTATLPRICVSNEDFALADDEVAGRIVEGVGAERAHLVFVARRIDKLLPSHWQERVKAQMTLSYADFLDHVLREGAHDWETSMLWSPHDVTTMIDRWAKYLDRDRITVVVADEDDRTMIPRTFEELLALPTGTLVPPEMQSNTSLSYPTTEALRRVNVLTRDEHWPTREYWRLVQSGIVPTLKERADDGLPRLKGIPTAFFDLVADRADAQIEAIRAAGVNVIGEPERLRVRDHVEPVEPPALIQSVSLDLLADIVSGTRRGAQRLHDSDVRKAARTAPVRPEDTSGRDLLALLLRRVGHRLLGGRSMAEEEPAKDGL